MVIDDADDEASVFDDSELPVSGSGEVDDPMLIDGPETVRFRRPSSMPYGH